MSTYAPTLRSVHREVSFPAIPEEAQAGMLALQFQYEETERWPAEEIDSQQFRQLAELLRFADRSIPFWRERLRRAGLRGGLKLTRQLFSRLPVLSQSQALADAARMWAPSLPPGHGVIVALGASSFATSQAAQFFQSSMILRRALWHGMVLEEKLASLYPGPDGSPLSPPTARRDWGDAFAPFLTGPAIALDARHPPAEQLAWLAREEAAYLLTTSVNALALARAALAAGTRLPRLRAIHVDHGPETEAAHAACQQAFGLPTIASHGTQATGLIALPCPEHGQLHVLSECARVEVLNARGQACAPGETGRLVVTPLHNFAMPLIRLDTGATAAVGPPCQCGRSLPVLAQIQTAMPAGA